MRRFLSVLCSLVLLSTLACGESNQVEDEIEDEVALANGWARVNAGLQELVRHDCRCHWQGSYESEDECLAHDELDYSVGTVEACLERTIDDLPNFLGDFTSYGECYQSAAEYFETCLDGAPRTCSDTNTANLFECWETTEDRMLSCDTLYGDPSWIEEFDDTAFVRCGLVP